MGKTNWPLNSTRQAQNESKKSLHWTLKYLSASKRYHCETFEPRSHKKVLLYSWKFLPNSAPFHWLLRGHMTSINETRISMYPLRETRSLSVYCCVAFSSQDVDSPNLIYSQLALTSAALRVTDSDYLDIAS